MKSQPPVALFVFNRSTDLPRTLQCLREAGVQTLYVFCDGPRNPKEQKETDRVRHIISDITWINPTIKEHSKNLGLSESIRTGLDEVFRTHDQVVVIEDDICVAPSFMPYITEALDRYQDDDRIAGVTGLRYPFSERSLRHYPPGCFFEPRFSSWGWGTWRRQWQSLDWDSSKLKQQLSPADGRRGGADLVEKMA